MEQLKVGDKVCREYQKRFSDFISYDFSEVERVTNTQAILRNGYRLINIPKKSYHRDYVEFEVYGDKYGANWAIVTDEILSRAKIEQIKIKANNWFGSHKFTIEQMVTIYDKFYTEFSTSEENK